MNSLKKYVPVGLIGLLVATLYGCDALGIGDDAESAEIIGTFAAANAPASKSADHCPDALIDINGEPADVEFFEDDDCSFEISDVPAGDEVTVSVELVDDGLSTSVAIQDVANDELIELRVDYGPNSLNVFVERRITPDDDDDDGDGDDDDDDDGFGDDDDNGDDDDRAGV